ncbi:MAG: sugar transferase [Mucilaginibacter sp.]|nr:sugar transferase [Mucilaginibacter sp.]
MVKRAFDFMCSLLGLIILLPFILIISLLIVLDSAGPAFYRQSRVGKNNINFILFKFRTMKIGSDKIGLLTVGNNDSRITRVGYWLRRYKIDELPQLVNVLFGDMSLVGPRPEVRKYVNLYNAEQGKVLFVKPGITDWASIKYSNENELLAKSKDAEQCYIDEIMPVKLNLNLEYIKHNNIYIDIKIILLTFKRLFS